MQRIELNGWKNNIRLANRDLEIVITADVGPRILRCGFIGGRNLFAEFAAQQGGTGEPDWKIRGGHRFWVAPEEKPKTYELDNEPIEVEEIPHGVRTIQPTGPLSGLRKTMEITLAPTRAEVKVVHQLKNVERKTIQAAPWALTVMAPDGTCVIPLPSKIAHTDRLTHNQEWSIWGYTDFTDPRWTLGSRYILFRQDRTRGPNKLGVAHREGWVAYQLGEHVFVKHFARLDDQVYPDGGVNFETFSNQEMLEVETLGPLVDLAPGDTVSHEETWRVFRGVKPCLTEDDVDRHILPLARR